MATFEHTLLQLLLLIGVINANPPHWRLTPFIIAAGLLLAFLPPVWEVDVPWDIILGLTIPLLLWQNARRMIHVKWRGKWNAFILWLGAAFLFAFVLVYLNSFDTTGAMLFGLIIAGVIWRAGESEETPGFISQIGPLTLVLLLSEIEPMITTPRYYLGGIFSGASFGIVIALLAIFISFKVGPGVRNKIAIGQIYLAYLLATLAGVSAVTAGLASAIVYVSLGIYRGLWQSNEVEPTPLNTWAGFGIMLALFLFLGWQAHRPISTILILEVFAGCIIGVLIAWAGYRLKLPSFIHQTTIGQAGFRVALLLFPALLIWPRNTIQEPVYLAFAFGIACLLLVISIITIDYYFKDKKS